MRHRKLSSGRGARGIAEIVGTLMLILIVVAAAIALAAFVASYQKQVLAEESQSQQRALEELKILSVTPVLNATNSSRWSSFSFVLASEYINPSGVDSISLNGQPLKVYWVSNLSSGSSSSPVPHASTAPFVLSPRQEVVIAVNLTAEPTTGFTWFSLYDPSFTLTTTDYIQLSVYTALQNTFTQVFIPPTAIAVVSSVNTFTGGVYVTVPILDGSNSFQPGNGTIVAWNWEVDTPSNATSTTANLSNTTVSSASSPVPETGTATFAEPAGFLTGVGITLNISYSGTGGNITPGSLGITSQFVSGGIVTVNYSFTYTVTGGGMGIISISATGATLSYTNSGSLHAFSGEKAEPSYWASEPAGTEFVIDLSVINSSDLIGVAQTTYDNP